MLAEGVPPAMIENAAKMAGMPVGPLALNDEVAIDLSLKIVRATIADLGEKAVDPRHHGARRNHGRERKAGWDARTARASMTIRRNPPRSICGRSIPEVLGKPKQDADHDQRRGAQTAPPRHASRWRAARDDGGKHASPTRAKRMSARSSPSDSRRIPAAQSPTSTAWDPLTC
jgi:3-hydroxyacyl-CoA dehydrogenase